MMSFRLNREQRLEKLCAHLRRSQVITPELMREVIAETCICFSALGNAARAGFNQLVAYGAWTDHLSDERAALSSRKAMLHRVKSRAWLNRRVWRTPMTSSNIGRSGYLPSLFAN
jgi:hypothetical protein